MAGLIVEDGTSVANANSYVTKAEFETFCTGRPGAELAAALSDDDQDEILIAACRVIETNLSWYGSPVNLTDRICSLPRTGMKMKEGKATFANNVIPKDIKTAQCEMALQLTFAKLMDQGKSDVTSMSVVGMTVGLKTRDNQGSRQDAIPTVVYDLLRPYGEFRTDEPSFQLSRHFWG